MKIQIGVIYRSAGQRVQVEAGHKRIGITSHDVTTGQQTYWFKDGEFEHVKYDLFEMASPLAKPVPVVRVVEETGDVVKKVSVPDNFPPHLHRAFVEKAELDEKLNKLHDFIQENSIFKTLPEDEQKRLQRQDLVMAEYSQILSERLGLTPEPVVVKTPVAEDAQEVFVPVPEPTSPTEIPAPVTIPPPPPAAPSTLADDIFAALAGRKIRVKDFAAELGLSPEILESTVSADPRFAKIVAGWVRVAEATAPASE